MDTIINAPRHFRLYGAVLAMAALLVTLLAVTLTAGPTQAQVDLDPDQLPRIGDNADEYDDPLPCSEKAVPDANTVGIIRDGYYALFDAFWDYEVGHLSNNFCPPAVTQTTEEDDEGEEVTVTTRTDANIHISETVFAIPDSYKVTVVDSRPGVTNGTSSDVTGDTINIADFPFLAENGAVSAVTTDGQFADNSLWWVRLDQPWTTDDETSDLQIGFSTDLLEEADWFKDENDDDVSDGPPVLFRFLAVHVLQDGTPQEAHVLGAHMFAFDQRATDTALEDPQWSNVRTATESEIEMQTGQYRQMQFAFTEPGVYLVQVNVEGYVQHTPPAGASNDWIPVSPDESITSPVQWYTFHVGPEADLDVALTAGAVSTTDGVSTMPITVTAENSGPNGAENVEVEINLPAGLSAPATLPSGATSSGCGVIAWEIGAMASGASPTLSFDATVDSGATGALTATAEIRSTTFDSDTENNSASVEATLGGTNVRPPFFPGVSRSIVEHAGAGAHAGDPVAAESPEGRVLTYTLSGPCSNKFQVHSNGQIVLASGHTLDYETQWEYPLVLSVSDGVNASGDADTSADDSTPVLIQVEDTEPTVHPTVTFELTLPNSDAAVTGDPVADGSTYWVRSTLNNAPEGATLVYDWDEQGWHNPVWANRLHTSYYPAEGLSAGPKAYTVHIKWPGGGVSAKYTINWVAQ